jgi:hypothetical protein
MDLLIPDTNNLGLQAIQRYRWSTHFAVHRYTRTRVLSLQWSHAGNGFITVSLSLQITHEVFFAPYNSFLAISSQSPSTAISKTRPNSWQLTLLQLKSLNCWQQLTLLNWTLLYNHFAENTAYIVKEACLLFRCLAMDVLLLPALAPAGMCLPSRCLAAGLYVIILCWWTRMVLQPVISTQVWT